MKTGTDIILITGFEPFGGAEINPSALVARRLDGALIAGRRVSGVVLSCVFGGAVAELEAAVARERPRLVLCLGLAENRRAITPERVALNLMDARIADNAGCQPVDEPVMPGAPPAYWSSLPVKAITAALQARGIPAEVSNSAGTFVCNEVFFALMHALRDEAGVRAGFIHLPPLPEQAADGQCGLPLETMVEAVSLAAEVCLAADT